MSAPRATAGIITTFASGGTSTDEGIPATDAQLIQPTGVVVDVEGNVYIAENAANVVRQVDALTGLITTIARDRSFGAEVDGSPAIAASLNSPQGVAVDAAGNVYFTDLWNHKVRRVDMTTGVITTVAGNGLPVSHYAASGDGGLATEACASTAWSADIPRVRSANDLTIGRGMSGEIPIPNSAVP